MDAHDEEVCKLRETVAGLQADVRAAKEAVPLALAAKEAINTAEKSDLKSNISLIGLFLLFLGLLVQILKK